MGKKGNQTTTQSVTIPPDVLARYNSVNARAEQVANTPFQRYSNDPSAFVAQLNPTQTAGIAGANAAANQAQPYYAQALTGYNAALNSTLPQVGAAYNATGAAFTNAQPYNQAALTGTQNAEATGQQYNLAATNNIVGGLGAAQPFNQAAATNYANAQQTGQAYNQAATGLVGNAANNAAPFIGQAANDLYGGQAAANAYQNQAGQQVNQAVQQANPYQAVATGFTVAGAGGVNPQAYSGQAVQQYMDPYLQNVVNTTMAAQGQQNAQQRSAMQGDAISAGAFGGDRAGIAQANLAYQQNLANSQTIANLYSQGFGQAQNQFNQQQGVNLGAEQANQARLTQAGSQLAQIGQQGFGQQLAAAGQNAALGNQVFSQGNAAAGTTAGLGQQAYAQQSGTGMNLANIGNQAYQQTQSTGQAQQGLGQQVYGQMTGTGQALANVGQQAYGQGLGAAQQTAALGQQGYEQGTGTAAQQAALANQAFGAQNTTAGNIAGLGNQAQTSAIQGSQAQLAAGQVQQQTEQAGKDALYNQFLQEKAYPFQTTEFLSNIAQGTGALSGTTTSTVKPGSFFSDERLKENIREIGKTHDGQKIYRYNFKGDPRSQIGLIAQEVEDTHPEAVGEARGFKTVDYDAATRDAVRDGRADGGGVLAHLPSMVSNAMLIHALRKIGDGRFGPGYSIPERADGGVVPRAAGGNVVDFPYGGRDKSGGYMAMIPLEGRSHQLITAGDIPEDNAPTAMDAVNTANGLAGLYKTGEEIFGDKPEDKAKDSVADALKEHFGFAAGGVVPDDPAYANKAGYMGLVPNDKENHELLTPNEQQQNKGGGGLGGLVKTGLSVAKIFGFANGGTVDEAYLLNPEVDDRPVDAMGNFIETKPAGVVPPKADPVAEAIPRIAQHESGGRDDARSPTSSASGKYQFTDGTWNDVVSRYPNLGLKPEDKMVPGKQDIAAPVYARELAGHLEKNGIEPTPGAIQMSWFLGPAGGPRFLQGMRQDPDAPGFSFASPEAVAANKPVFFDNDGTPRSARDVYARTTGDQHAGVAPPRQAAPAPSQGGVVPAADAGISDVPTPDMGGLVPMQRPAAPVAAAEKAEKPHGIGGWLSDPAHLALLAAIGGTLTSPSRSLIGSLGSGALAAAQTYGQAQQRMAGTELQRAQAENIPQQLEIYRGKLDVERTGQALQAYKDFQGRFRPVLDENNQPAYFDSISNSIISAPEYQQKLAAFRESAGLNKLYGAAGVGASSKSSPAPAPAVVTSTSAPAPQQTTPVGTPQPGAAPVQPSAVAQAPGASRDDIWTRNGVADTYNPAKLNAEADKLQDRLTYLRTSGMDPDGKQGEGLLNQINQLRDRASKVGTGDITPLDNNNNPVVIPEVLNAAAQKAVTAEVLRKQTQNVYDTRRELDQSYVQRQIAENQVQAMANILEHYEPGAFAQQKAGIIAKLRAIGIPFNDSDTANPAAFQAFMKNATRAAASDTRALGSNVAASTFDQIQHSNPNADLQPEAAQKILAQMLGEMRWNDAQRDAFVKWHDKHPTAQTASDFYTEWMPANPVAKYVDDARKGLAVTGIFPANPSDAVPGQAYIMPAGTVFGGEKTQKPMKVVAEQGADGNMVYRPVDAGAPSGPKPQITPEEARAELARRKAAQ
jgi:hypothetical protein